MYKIILVRVDLVNQYFINKKIPDINVTFKEYSPVTMFFI